MTKHAGKATKAALRIIFWTLVLLLSLLAAGALLIFISRWIMFLSEHKLGIAGALAGIWVIFTVFTIYFFRDPKPLVSSLTNAIVAPAHGKVDVIDEMLEPEVMGGPCQRISIFLSVFDVHVQRAPVSGKVVYMKHKPGRFMSATKTHSAEHNENVLLGFELKGAPEKRVGLRLIAGLIARRIIPWLTIGEEIERSERISLIQFGSRCDLYLPPGVKIHVKLGERVKGGETILASWD